MSKVRKIVEITANIPFTEFDFYDLFKSTFEKSELGRIKKMLPLHEMAENFGLVRKSQRPKLGRKSYFTRGHPGKRPKQNREHQQALCEADSKGQGGQVG